MTSSPQKSAIPQTPPSTVATKPSAPASKPAPKSSVIDKIQPFAIGGLSGMLSTTIVQPVDMIKVQIQVRSEGGKTRVGPLQVVRQIFSEGKGLSFFYKGLDSALIRQITYTTVRMGVYKTLFDEHKQKHGTVSMGYKSLFGLTAGFVGSFFGNPADLILIRLQADQNLKPELRRNYKNFFDAFGRIVREEGPLALWRGCVPTILRAMVLNFGMLGPFDEVKEQLNRRTKGPKDTISIRLTASAIAGFLCAFLSLPFDNIKTKLQKMVKRPDGTFPYSGITDCFIKSVKNEGVTKLWVGFPTFYFRIAPHAMFTLLFQDYITDSVKRLRGK